MDTTKTQYPRPAVKTLTQKVMSKLNDTGLIILFLSNVVKLFLEDEAQCSSVIRYNALMCFGLIVGRFASR